MPTYAYPSRTKVLDTATVATLEDALHNYDIPQAYTNAALCQLFLGTAKEPGLELQGSDLMMPGGKRPEIKVRGGSRAEVFVNFEPGTTAQTFTGLDILDTSLAEGPTVTWTDWALYTCYYAIAFSDSIKNTGAMKRLDILRARQNQEIRRMTRLMETHLNSTNGDTVEGTQNAFAGLDHKVIADPTSSTVVQGLNQSTFTPWRNATDASVGSFASGGLDAFRSMHFSVSGTNAHEPPDLIYTTPTVAGYFVKALEGIHRITGNLNGNDLSASRLPTFMGTPILHSSDCTSGTAKILNFDYMCSLIHEEGNWGEIIPGEPNDQAVRGQRRKVFVAAPMLTTRREKQGYLGGITA
jgi:hypothetical protein